jgi:hypothetical protein
MKLHDTFGMKGHFKIFGRYSPEEPWVLLRDQDNLIVDTTNYLQSFAIGSGTTTPTTSDTDLETAIAYSGTDVYKAFEEYTEDDYKTVTYVGYLSSLEPSTTVTITEIGLFTGTGENGEIMVCRATFEGITKTNSLEIRIEYSLSI